MAGLRLIRAIPHFLSALRRNASGLALIEFALGLPIVLLMSLTGAELTHYVTVKMRVSQLALSLADNAARMGEGDRLAAKQISETDINDVLTGAGLQASDLDLYTNGRVIVSSLEPESGRNTYRIAWQRCRGAKLHDSLYGETGDTDPDGIGPDGQKVEATRRNATIFVEVYYEYTPLISESLAPNLQMDEIASMDVRDRRDLSGIYNNENAPVAECANFDDGNNGNGNDSDGSDSGNPGHGGDGNNGHGNDADGNDESNPGNGNGGHGKGNEGHGHGKK